MIKGAFDSAVDIFQKAELNLMKDKPELMHFIKDIDPRGTRNRNTLKCAFTISI